MNFIIVLGSSDAEKRRSRVETAVNYYKKLMEDHIEITRKVGTNSFSAYNDLPVERDVNIRLVFSGKGHNSVIMTEAQDMCRIAVELGIPKNLCILENESNNTHENILNTLNLLRTYSWFKPTFHSLKPTFTICTSRFHAKRSLVIGMYILSNDGYVSIIHTNESVSKESAEREAFILNNYIENVILPNRTDKY